MAKYTTDYLDPNEPCHGLREYNRKLSGPNGSEEWHRVQAVYVVRDLPEGGDAIAEYVTDMGSAWLWEHAPEIQMLATGEVSVAEWQYLAERDRNDSYGLKLKEELRESSTLIQDFLQEKEENWKRIKNQSQFGPKHSKQRNGYPYHEMQKQVYR